MGGNLSGIRVLDFTRVLAGPLCTMLLGDLGADVIKVESPAGDETRQWGPPWLGEDNDHRSGDSRQSAYFLSVNRNKRGLVLNLKSAEGQHIARALARQSHILIENFKPGQMASFGLDYESLKAENPALVYASITGFGQTGPYRDRPGYDHVIQAMSGLMSITGPTDGEPHKVGVAVSDVITGLFALSGILAALRSAEQTGIGQYLDFALLDSQLAGLVNIASSALVSGQTPSRYGNRHANIVPYQNFSANDGDFSVAVGNDGQFRALCRVIGRPDMADDPRYATNPARVQNRESLVYTLQTIFWSRTADAWVDALLAEGIPAGPINTVSAALDDPHVAARGLVRETTLESGETLRYVASPLMGVDAELRYPPPTLGQHSETVLRELLHYDDGDIAVYFQSLI